MKLYSASYAPNPRRVTMFLAEKGVTDIEIQTINLIAQDHRAPDYVALSPLAQAPTLVLDDGRALTESRAICTYLEGLYPEPNLLGRDAKERAFIEMWDRRVEYGLFLGCALWVRHGHPVLAAIEPEQSADVSEYGRKRALHHAAYFNEELAKREWIAGDRFTIADITAAAGMDFAKMLKWRPGDDLPHLKRWREALGARAAGQVAA